MNLCIIVFKYYWKMENWRSKFISTPDLNTFFFEKYFQNQIKIFTQN